MIKSVFLGWSNSAIVGARGAGINRVLLERYHLYPEVMDCPRRQSLAELPTYLN